jgi:hypothetical protein
MGMRVTLGALLAVVVLAGGSGRALAGDLFGYRFAFGTSC